MWASHCPRKRIYTEKSNRKENANAKKQRDNQTLYIPDMTAGSG